MKLMGWDPTTAVFDRYIPSVTKNDIVNRTYNQIGMRLTKLYEVFDVSIIEAICMNVVNPIKRSNKPAALATFDGGNGAKLVHAD